MSTVQLWRKIVLEQGTLALAPKPRSGRTPKLNDKQLVQLKRLLKKGATKFGYANAIWTSRRVRQLIKDQFDVSYSKAQTCRILRKIGYSPKKPVKRSKKYSRQAIEHWLRYKWPHILPVSEIFGSDFISRQDAKYFTRRHKVNKGRKEFLKNFANFVFFAPWRELRICVKSPA